MASAEMTAGPCNLEPVQEPPQQCFEVDSREFSGLSDASGSVARGTGAHVASRQTRPQAAAGAAPVGWACGAPLGGVTTDGSSSGPILEDAIELSSDSRVTMAAVDRVATQSTSSSPRELAE